MTEKIRIGIMADSHGIPDTIVRAVGLFRKENCRLIYHLGDICDSTHPETAELCAGILRINNVAAVKGNNDHAISANPDGNISEDTLSYLSSLPLVAGYGEAIFTHSLPFVATLGLACMIRSLGSKEAALFFAEYPKNILFRGHSHSPEIIWKEGEKKIARKIKPGEKTELHGKLPCIITCGSLADGFCMIWKPEENSVECCLM